MNKQSKNDPKLSPEKDGRVQSNSHAVEHLDVQLPSEELVRPILTSCLGPEVFGYLCKAEDAGGKNKLDRAVTCAQIVKESERRFAATTVQRVLTALLAASLIEVVEQPNKRMKCFCLTDLGREIAKGDYGREARASWEKALKQPHPQKSDELLSSRLEQLISEKNLNRPETLLALGIAHNRERYELAGSKSKVFLETLRDLSGTMTDAAAYRFLAGLVKEGILQKCSANSYELASLGHLAYARFKGEISELLPIAEKRAEETAEKLKRVQGLIEQKLVQFPHLGDAYAWVSEQPLVRIPILHSLIESSDRTNDGRALANHVGMAWRMRTGQKIKDPAIRRYFQEFRERKLLEPNDRPTLLARELRQLLQEVEQATGSSSSAQERNASAGDGTIVPSTNDVNSDQNMPEDEIAQELQSDAAVPEVEPVFDTTLPTSKEEEPEPEIAFTSPGVEPSSVVKSVRQLAHEYEELTEILEAARIRPVDRELLSKQGLSVAAELLPAANALAELEEALAPLSPGAPPEFELKGDSLLVHLDDVPPHIVDLLNLAEKSPKLLPAGWAIEAQSVSREVPIYEKQVEGLISELHNGSSALLRNYPAVDIELSNLAQFFAITLANPLLSADAKQVETRAAVGRLQELLISYFYAEARHQGYPSCRDQSSGEAHLEINRLCTALQSSVPEAVAVALVGHRLGATREQAIGLCKAIMRCRQALELAGIPLNQVFSALAPSRMEQSARLDKVSRKQASEEFEYRSLSVQGCGLIVRPIGHAPYFVVVSIRISPDTDLVDVVLLLKDFLLARESVMRREVSAQGAVQHLAPRQLEQSEYSDRFRPPLAQSGTIIITDGRFVRPHTITRAGFFAVFGQQPQSALVELQSCAFDTRGPRRLQSELDACLRYNNSLLDGLLHGPRRLRLTISAPSHGQVSAGITVVEPAQDSATTAKWLSLLADKVVQGDLAETFVPLLASSPASKQVQRALAGAEGLSRILSQTQSVQSAHHLTLTAVDSGSDRLSLEFGVQDSARFRKLLSPQHAQSSAETSTDADLNPDDIATASSVVASARYLPESRSLLTRVREYRDRLLYLESCAFEERFDLSVFHRRKAEILREAFKNEHEYSKLVGAVGALSGAQVRAVLQARETTSGASAEREAERLATIFRISGNAGFLNPEVSTDPRIPLTLSDPKRGEIVTLEDGLDCGLDQHILVDTLGADPSFMIDFSWNRFELALSPRVRKIWVSPLVDMTQLEQTLGGIHRAIYKQFVEGAIDVGRALRQKRKPSITLSVRDSFEGRFEGFGGSGRAVCLTDGVPFIERQAEAAGAVRLERFSYALRVRPVWHSKIARFDGLLLSAELSKKSDSAEGFQSELGLQALDEVALSVLRYNAEMKP